MSEKKLKPCPFCGGKPEVVRQGSARQSHIISCTWCGCTLETGEVFNAGAQWNSRFEPTQQTKKEQGE